MMRTMIAWALIAAAGCGGGGSSPGKTATAPAASAAKPGDAAAAEPGVSPVVSSDILAREPVANTAMVKHILISWSDLGDSFGGRLDPRAAKRSKADAENEVRAILKLLKDGADFDTVMKERSEDQGSAASGHEFKVTPDAQLVIEFRQLSLRLNVGEVGVVQSDFGFHIIKRFS
ncbi:MAG TPA: peptidylprolyl isomerase [Kofleriaceae bacterium]|nr:peptidylprolyl isomerase [Kofleriaceae bacterium]